MMGFDFEFPGWLMPALIGGGLALLSFPVALTGALLIDRSRHRRWRRFLVVWSIVTGLPWLLLLGRTFLAWTRILP